MDPLEAGEARETGVVGMELRAVLDGQRRTHENIMMSYLERVKMPDSAC
jgi:hypothetical protein